MERISAPFWASCDMIRGDWNLRRAQELEMLEMAIFWLVGAAPGREEMAMDDSVLLPQKTTDLQCQYLRGRVGAEHCRTGQQLVPSPNRKRRHPDNGGLSTEAVSMETKERKDRDENSDAAGDLTDE